jgi:hypothetical protein
LNNNLFVLWFNIDEITVDIYIYIKLFNLEVEN